MSQGIYKSSTMSYYSLNRILFFLHHAPLYIPYESREFIDSSEQVLPCVAMLQGITCS